MSCATTAKLLLGVVISAFTLVFIIFVMKCKFKIGFQMNMCYYLWWEYLTNIYRHINSCAEMSVSDFTFHPLLSSVKLFRLFRIELELKFASPGSLRAWLDNLKRVRAGSRKLLAQYLTKGNSIIGVKIDFYIFCHLSSRHQIQEKKSKYFYPCEKLFWNSFWFVEPSYQNVSKICENWNFKARSFFQSLGYKKN